MSRKFLIQLFIIFFAAGNILLALALKQLSGRIADPTSLNFTKRRTIMGSYQKQVETEFSKENAKIIKDWNEKELSRLRGREGFSIGVGYLILGLFSLLHLPLSLFILVILELFLFLNLLVEGYFSYFDFFAVICFMGAIGYAKKQAVEKS